MAVGLLDLAWCALPEEKIVAKTANELLEDGYYWERGEKGIVRERVKDSHPPRGYKKKRLEAVIKELKRQKDIRYRRKYTNPPINWRKWRPAGVDERRKAVAQHLLRKEVGCCFLFRKVDGFRVMVVGQSTYYPSYVKLGVVSPRGKRRIYEIKKDRLSRYTSLTRLLLFAFTPKETERYLLEGGRVRFDFAKGETIFTDREGEEITISWRSRAVPRKKKKKQCA